MRTHGSREQQDAIKSTPRKQLQKVFQVNNFLFIFWLCCFFFATDCSLFVTAVPFLINAVKCNIISFEETFG